MATFEEITAGVMSGTPSVSPSTSIASNAGKSFQDITKSVMSGAPSVPAPVDTRSTFKKATEAVGNFSESFVTGLGSSTGRILDQVFHLGTTFLKQKEGMLDKGFDLLGIKNPIKFADKLEERRLRLKENLGLGAEVARENNPLSDTFVGQTAEIIGGVVPQVALAFAKAPQVVLALSESVMNAEDSYDKNVADGMDKKEALKRAVPQLGADLLGTYITNKLGAVGKFSGEGKTFFKSKLVESLKDSGLEIAQEVWQTGLQNLAEDRPFTSGMGETAKLTIIPAILFGAAGNISQQTPEQQTELKQKVSDAIVVINEKAQRGEELTEQEQAVQALTEGIDPFAQPGSAVIPEAPTIEKAMEISSEQSPIPVEVAQEDVTKGDNTFVPRVFERLKEEQPEILTGDLQAERIRLEDEAKKAIDLIAQDKQKAFDIAMGIETSKDVTATAVNIALAEKALDEGNTELYAKLIRNRALAQTRRGQEIVSEKGSVKDNSVARYVKELIALRLDILGDKYLSGIKEENPKMRTRKKKAINIIDEQVGKLEKKIKAKKLDVKTAISLLDKLKCI